MLPPGIVFSQVTWRPTATTTQPIGFEPWHKREKGQRVDQQYGAVNPSVLVPGITPIGAVVTVMVLSEYYERRL